MSKVSRDKKKAAAEGKSAPKSKKIKELAEAPVKEVKAKGYPDACCRCKSYKKTVDDGPKCKITGKHVARKSCCEKFSKDN